MSPHPPRFALRSTRVASLMRFGPATIVISGETIESILPHDAPIDCPLTDLGNLVIMPGLVDTHVHINEPGARGGTQWEGFDSATRAAAAAGITTLIDMPLNSTPVTTTVLALERKRAAAKNKIHVDVGFHGGLIHDNTTHIEPLLNAGAFAIKAFLVHSGIDDFPAAQESDLRATMKILAAKKIPLLAHAELDHTPPQNLSNNRGGDPRSYARYLASRPPHWETRAINLLINLAKETGCHVHIVHLATEEALPQLIAARAAGLPITIETCPHYLYFAAEQIPDGATHFKCAPPIRSTKTRTALWQALQQNHIDMIASDHSPCPPDLKHLDTGDFTKAWGGISSLQLTLPITWTAGAPHNITLNNLAQWLSTFPASLVNLQQKGAIVPGKDADLAIFNPDAEWAVKSADLHHRHKLTPYDNQILRGKVTQTYLRGQLIFDNGAFPTQNAGQLLTRTSPP